MDEIDPAVSAIASAMEAKGYKPADLGRVLSLDSSQVHRLLRGKRRLQIHEARTAQEWLGLAPTSARGGSATILAGPGMIPLYGWSGAQLTISELNLRGFAPMHPAQLHIRDAFAVEVNDVAMFPRYEPGEIAYVAPNRWPRPNQDGLFILEGDEGLLVRFVSRTHDEMIVHQLDPPRDRNIAVKTVIQHHAIVGRG